MVVVVISEQWVDRSKGKIVARGCVCRVRHVATRMRFLRDGLGNLNLERPISLRKGVGGIRKCT